MEEIEVVLKKFGDEQSSLLDRFERLSVEVQLNQAILRRSLSEPSPVRSEAPAAPPPMVSQVRRSTGFKKALKKLLKPILGRRSVRRGEVPNPKDPKLLKAFSRSLRF